MVAIKNIKQRQLGWDSLQHVVEEATFVFSPTQPEFQLYCAEHTAR